MFSDFMSLTLSWRRPSSYRNQSIDVQSKSMDWFLYDRDFRQERVKTKKNFNNVYRIAVGVLHPNVVEQ